MIDDFRPDVFAVDAPLTRVVVGEAKTQLDLETLHSKNQFLSFVKYLAGQAQPVLVVAVLWQAKARARTLLQTLIVAQENGESIELVVVDEIGVLA